MPKEFFKELNECLKKKDILKTNKTMREFLIGLNIDLDEFKNYISGDMLPSEEYINKILDKAQIVGRQKDRLKLKYYEEKWDAII